MHLMCNTNISEWCGVCSCVCAYSYVYMREMCVQEPRCRAINAVSGSFN